MTGNINSTMMLESQIHYWENISVILDGFVHYSNVQA